MLLEFCCWIIFFFLHSSTKFRRVTHQQELNVLIKTSENREYFGKPKLFQLFTGRVIILFQPITVNTIPPIVLNFKCNWFLTPSWRQSTSLSESSLKSIELDTLFLKQSVNCCFMIRQPLMFKLATVASLKINFMYFTFFLLDVENNYIFIFIKSR